jgi:hypothetical protein
VLRLDNVVRAVEHGLHSGRHSLQRRPATPTQHGVTRPPQHTPPPRRHRRRHALGLRRWTSPWLLRLRSTLVRHDNSAVDHPDAHHEFAQTPSRSAAARAARPSNAAAPQLHRTCSHGNTGQRTRGSSGRPAPVVVRHLLVAELNLKKCSLIAAEVSCSVPRPCGAR